MYGLISLIIAHVCIMHCMPVPRFCVALSIHPLPVSLSMRIHAQSQGMSLDRAKISLDNVFEYGQAYVALSRVRSLAGLELSGFAKHTVRAHPKVIEFYAQLAATIKANTSTAAATT